MATKKKTEDVVEEVAEAAEEVVDEPAEEVAEAAEEVVDETAEEVAEAAEEVVDETAEPAEEVVEGAFVDGDVAIVEEVVAPTKAELKQIKDVKGTVTDIELDDKVVKKLSKLNVILKVDGGFVRGFNYDKYFD